jgi:glycosyltransferase involved in cell wall biosynthesis
MIPVKNGEQFIAQALDSVRAQTYRDFEVVVVDDASTDRTSEIVKRYPEVKYVLRERSEGVSAARNTAIRAATGRYLANLDCDDVWYPNKLALQVPILEQCPEVGVVYCDQEWVDEEGRTVTVARCSNWPKSWEKHFYGGHNVGPSAMVVRKELLEKVGLFDERLYTNDDKDICIRLYDLCRFRCVEQPLVKRRLARQPYGVRQNQREEVLNCIPVFLGKLELRALTPAQRRYLDREWSYHFSNMGKYLMGKGQRLLAMKHFAVAIRRDPFVAKTYGRVFRCLLGLT